MSGPTPSNRRDFLTGQAVRAEWEQVQNRLADEIAAPRVTPGRGPTLLLQTTAMACDFDVMLNPDGPDSQIESASAALEHVHELERLMSVYREDAHLATINRLAPTAAVEVDAELFLLLRRAELIASRQRIRSGGRRTRRAVASLSK